MTINAPVQAPIINPEDVNGLVMAAGFNWTWVERAHAQPPSHEEIFESAKLAFSEKPTFVTFMVAVTVGETKMIDFITGRITSVRYESGIPGMLMIELNSDDKRWTKIHGYYNCRPESSRVSGWLSLTLRR